MLQTVALKTVSFRALTSKIDRIDLLADVQQRDRTFVLNEAIDQYLELHDRQRMLIEQGLADARAGRLLPQLAVEKQLAARRKRRSPR